MKITFLGTGTSCGVPTIGCRCHTCSSTDSHDKRLRCSALVENEDTRLLIDCGPDFRQQMMTQEFRRIDGILITHAHYDHMGGLDDIRPFCQFGDVNVYADPIARKGLLQMLPYCFVEHRYPNTPAIQLHEMKRHEPFRVGSIDIMPLQVMHHDLPITGFRIGNLVYITDMKTISDEEIPYIEGIDLLVVNALRLKPHHSHQTLEEALGFIRRVKARRSFLIHSSHDMPREKEVNALLPSDVKMAYDGLVVEF